MHRIITGFLLKQAGRKRSAADTGVLGEQIFGKEVLFVHPKLMIAGTQVPIRAAFVHPQS